MCYLLAICVHFGTNNYDVSIKLTSEYYFPVGISKAEPLVSASNFLPNEVIN
jgi:hypothetical protein